MSDNQTAEYFDSLAPTWDARYQRSRFFRQRYRLFERAIAQYGAGAERALDYGCGSGVLTELLVQRAETVVAADISEKMRDAARDRFADNPQVVVAEIDELEPASFDLVLCSSVIEYANDPGELLATLAGLPRPGGVLLVTFPNRLGPLQLLNRHVLARFQRGGYTAMQRHLFSRRSILALADAAGLAPLQLHTPVGLPPFRFLGWGELFFLAARNAPDG